MAGSEVRFMPPVRPVSSASRLTAYGQKYIPSTFAKHLYNISRSILFTHEDLRRIACEGSAAEYSSKSFRECDLTDMKVPSGNDAAGLARSGQVHLRIVRSVDRDGSHRLILTQFLPETRAEPK